MTHFDPNYRSSPESHLPRVSPSRRQQSPTNIYSLSNIFRSLVHRALSRSSPALEGRESQIHATSETKIATKKSFNDKVHKIWQRLYPEAVTRKITSLINERKIVHVLKHFENGPAPRVPVTLFDVRETLEFIYNQLLIDDNTSPEFRKSLANLYSGYDHGIQSGEGYEAHFLKELKKIKATTHSEKKLVKLAATHVNMMKYFRTTNQFDEIKELELEMKRKAFFQYGQAANPEFKEYLAHDVVLNIAFKIISDEPSISGLPLQLISLEDVNFLRSTTIKFDEDRVEGAAAYFEQAKEGLEERLRELNAFVSQYSGLVTQLQSKQFPLKTPLTQEDLALIVQGKQALLDIELSDIGRHFNLKEIKEIISGLTLFYKCQEVRGEDVDLAVLQAICKQHDSMPHHVKVGIEGGGPTGLMLALTQFQAGSDVCLFEKRSTLFDRTQVVRLDPKWVVQMQFYLGEKFYQLFVDNKHTGTFREDGYVEIVTRDLEDILNQRLAELTSMANGSIEMLAAHEMREVVRPRNPGEGKFKVQASYIPEQGAPWGTSPHHTETVEREIDFLFCAGGKSSPLMKTFLPSSVPITQDKFYGVCSWMTKDLSPFKGQKGTLNHFQDFRGVVKIDEKFIDSFKSSAIEKIMNSLKCAKRDVKLFDNIDLNKWLEQPFFQTRTFENRGLIYIGMELPDELQQLLSEIPDNGQRELIEADIHTAWFEQIGKLYKVGKDLSIDTKFLSMFPVDQTQLDENQAYSEIDVDGSKLFVTAAGDAATSPHFMRYSGLTGARQNILDIQSLVAALTRNPANKAEIIETFNQKMKVTADLVAGRGNAFLRNRDGNDIVEDRFNGALSSLQSAVTSWNNPKLTQEGEGKDASFSFVIDQQKYVISLSREKPGSFEIKNPDGTSREYQSLKQIKLIFNVI